MPPDISRHQIVITGLQRADIDHHIKLARAVEYRTSCFHRLWCPGAFEPSGNPITVQTFTPLLGRAGCFSDPNRFMQTDANPYRTPSSQTFSTSSRVASGRQGVIDVPCDLAGSFAFGAVRPNRTPSAIKGASDPGTSQNIHRGANHVGCPARCRDATE
jgi:hypothetical protein